MGAAVADESSARGEEGGEGERGARGVILSEPVRWTREELVAYYARLGNARAAAIPPGPTIENIGLPKRTQPTRGKMNKVESAYALFLDHLKQAGGVKNYRFESVTLLLAPGCRYTPDFFVECKDGSLECHEVKTRWRNAKQRGPNMTDDARVKLLTAARLYPEFNFVLAWLDGNGGWHMENIEK